MKFFSGMMSVSRLIFHKSVNRGKLTCPFYTRFGARNAIKCKNGKLLIGHNFSSYSNVEIDVEDGNVTIGDEVFINKNCLFVCHNSVTIGNSVLFGPNVVIYDHNHIFGSSGVEKGFSTGCVVIEDYCWIGAGTTILKNAYIGEGSVIGAGCIISGYIPPHSLVVNNRELIINPIA